MPLGSLFLFGHLFLSYFTDVKRNNDYTIICRLGAMEDAWRMKRYMHKNPSIPRALDRFARYGSGRDEDRGLPHAAATGPIQVETSDADQRRHASLRRRGQSAA